LFSSVAFFFQDSTSLLLMEHGPKPKKSLVLFLHPFHIFV
jgi:hypothetical protein